jgi:hypothetical protein
MNKIPMLERFAAQSLVEYDGELIFSKEKFAELIVQECAEVCFSIDKEYEGEDVLATWCADGILKHFGVEE